MIEFGAGGGDLVEKVKGVGGWVKVGVEEIPSLWNLQKWSLQFGGMACAFGEHLAGRG